MKAVTENDFEEAIVAHLTAHSGWQEAQDEVFDPEVALVPGSVIGFLQATQAPLWARLEQQHGADLASSVLTALQKELGLKGSLHVLRHGFSFYGQKLKMACFRPAHGLNPEVMEQYRANRLEVIDLAEGEVGEVSAPVHVGTGRPDEEHAPLSTIIDVLNERFGTEFTEADRLFFEQVEEEAAKDEQVQAAAKNTPLDDFTKSLTSVFERLMVERLEQNGDIVDRFLDNPDFKRLASSLMAKNLYDRLSGEQPSPAA